MTIQRASNARNPEDPALVASMAWIDAHAITQARCVEQQDLEAILIRCGGEGGDLQRKHEQALQAEQVSTETEAALLERLASTAATSLAGIAAKLAVVVRESEDNTDLADFPLPQVKSALDDLRRVIEQAALEQVTGVSTAGSPHTDAALAATCAFQAWCQGDDKRYRIWMKAFKALERPVADL